MGRIVHIYVRWGWWCLALNQGSIHASYYYCSPFSFYVSFFCVSLQMILSTKVCFVCGELRKRNHIPGRFHPGMLTLQAPDRKAGRNNTSGLCFGKYQA